MPPVQLRLLSWTRIGGFDFALIQVTPAVGPRFTTGFCPLPHLEETLPQRLGYGMARAAQVDGFVALFRKAVGAGPAGTSLLVHHSLLAQGIDWVPGRGTLLDVVTRGDHALATQAARYPTGRG
jgi:hypothetical protein